jgi:integrase/recombinase XerD
MLQMSTMLINAAVSDYLYALSSKSPLTRTSARTILLQFTEWCTQQDIDLEQLKPVHVRQYTDFLRTRPSQHNGTPLSSSTVHSHITRLKAFLAWCHQEECYKVGLSEKAVKRIELPAVEAKVVGVITPEMFKKLYTACDHERYENHAQRNRAILSVLLDTGIRAAELCSLTLDQVYFGEDTSFIRVYGKGRKWREAALGEKARKALRNYILRYRHASKSEVHVFVSRFGGPLTPGGIDQLLYALADRAGIDRDHASAHKFRHSFAVNFLKNGGDLYKLSRLLGHASVSITERYLRAFTAQDARTGNISVLDNL